MIDGGGAEGRWIWWDGADDGWIKIWSSLSVFFSFWEKSDPPSISDFFFRHWLTSLPDLLASVTVNRRIPQPPGSCVCVHSTPLHPHRNLSFVWVAKVWMWVMQPRSSAHTWPVTVNKEFSYRFPENEKIRPGVSAPSPSSDFLFSQ